MMMQKTTLAGIASLALLTGCALQPQQQPEPTYESAARSDFLASNYRAADALVGQFRNRAANGPLLVATVVNIDALEQSSTLGRLISEQISARFAQSGFTIIEMKFRNNVYMKRSEGELLLTREINEVARSHSAQAVIVGTYGTSANAVFVDMKIVDPGTNSILAVHDYVLPRDREVQSMMSRNVVQ
jgi:TolB-like protein